MKQTFNLKPIGIIYTSYYEQNDAPRQGTLKPNQEGTIEIFEDYQKGLKDLNRFSHLILIFYFHKSTRENLTATPPNEMKERGIFATRGPHRPNHLGITVVKIKEIRKNQLLVEGVDMLNETPLLDIKPYVKELDCRENAFN